MELLIICKFFILFKKLEITCEPLPKYDNFATHNVHNNYKHLSENCHVCCSEPLNLSLCTSFIGLGHNF